MRGSEAESLEQVPTSFRFTYANAQADHGKPVIIGALLLIVDSIQDDVYMQRFENIMMVWVLT